MACREYNYVAKILGCDDRSPEGFSATVRLAESKNYYITPRGHKFNKTDGTASNDANPMFTLDLTSVRLY